MGGDYNEYLGYKLARQGRSLCQARRLVAGTRKERALLALDPGQMIFAQHDERRLRAHVVEKVITAGSTLY